MGWNSILLTYFVLHILAETLSLIRSHSQHNPFNLALYKNSSPIFFIAPQTIDSEFCSFRGIYRIISGTLLPSDLFSPSRKQFHSTFVSKCNVIPKIRIELSSLCATLSDSSHLTHLINVFSLISV